MLVYLPTANKDIQDKAFEYANSMLSDINQLELIPYNAPFHALMGNPEGRPSTYEELRNCQLEQEKMNGYSSFDFASVNSNNEVVGIMGYNTRPDGDRIFGYGPWLAQREKIGITFEKDMIAIYDEVLKNTHETWVSVFCGKYNEEKMRLTYRDKDKQNAWQRQVINKYERKTSQITTVRKTLAGNHVKTYCVILKGALE